MKRAVKRAICGENLPTKPNAETISRDEWRRYQDIVKLIPELSSYKRETVYWVRDKGAERGYPTLFEYYPALMESEEERDYLRIRLTNPGSHFFRGNDWEYFVSECLSTFAGRSDIEVWCAGCATGEEAYSTVMGLLDYVTPADIDVLATDYNDESLAYCDEGSYFNMHLEAVPERYRHHLDLGKPKFRIKDELRAVVHTQHLNLIFDEYPAPFDIILCRNVIKFFADDVREQVKARLAASLKPGGFLYVSRDDGETSKELIVDPMALGLEQLDGRPIYRKFSE